MKKEHKISSERVSFICYLTAAICYFISAAIDMADKNDSVVINIGLGSAFLCLALSYRSKDKNKED